MSDNKLLHFKNREREEEVRGSDATWKILIVDDDEEVHLVTRLVLRDKYMLGKRLELFSVKSAAECREFLKRETDISVLLLDVVMETDDAGLLLAEWIRCELGNQSLRIILRTGQPGMAPLTTVIAKYEINDYKEKTELTHEKLWATILTAIRGYRDIKIIEQSRFGMQMILEAAPELFKLQSLKLFASGILTQLISILNVGKDAALLDISGFAASLSDSTYKVLAGTGKFKNADQYTLAGLLSEQCKKTITEAIQKKGISISGDDLAICVNCREHEKNVIYMEKCRDLNDIDRDIIGLFCTNVSAAFMNIGLYNELEDRLDEKSMLVREIHHRVKNNLQIILSLVDMTDKSRPEDAFESVRRRISAMAVIHDRVSTLPNEKRIDFTDCAADIAADVAHSAAIGPNIPTIITNTENFVLPLETAVPCSLLLEELLSHALYLRTGQSPIEVRLEGKNSGEHSITISFEHDAERMECSDNINLATNLAAQIAGRIQTECQGKTTVITAIFTS